MTQLGKLLNIAGEQKRIGSALQRDGAGNRGQTLAARFDDFTESCLDGLMPRQSCVGKDQIALRVFMRTKHQGRFRQLTQALQGIKHLCGRAFKKPSAATGK